VILVVKLRARKHSKELRTYEITENGLVVGAALTHYRGILTGDAELLIPA
jgi:circadian clock protein KaiC